MRHLQTSFFVLFFGIILEHSGNPLNQNQTSKFQILYIRLGEAFFTFPTCSLICKDLYPWGQDLEALSYQAINGTKKSCADKWLFRTLPPLKTLRWEDFPCSIQPLPVPTPMENRASLPEAPWPWASAREDSSGPGGPRRGLRSRLQGQAAAMQLCPHVPSTPDCGRQKIG